MNRVERVFFVIDSLSGGGAERVLTILANQFDSSGVDVTVGLLNPQNVSKPFPLHPNIKVIVLPKKNNSRLLRLISCYIEIRHYIKKTKPDFIIPFMVHVSLQVLLACMNLKCSVVIRPANDPKNEIESPLMHLAVRLLFPIACGAVYQNSIQREFYQKYLRCEGVTIFNPTNPSPLWNIHREDVSNTIIAIGRFVEAKNYLLLVRAYKEVYEIYPDWCLTIYGEGPLREQIETEIERLKLSSYVFLPGFIENIEEKLYNSSIYVICSFYEGMPNTLIEAMCMGLPCISTDFCGGSAKRLIEDGVNGIIIPSEDTEALSSALRKLINDSDLRRKMGSKASDLRKIVNSDTISKQWLEYLQGISKRSKNVMTTYL